MSLAGGGEELGDGHDSEAHEGVALSDLLALVPHLEQDLRAGLRDLSKHGGQHRALTAGAHSSHGEGVVPAVLRPRPHPRLVLLARLVHLQHHVGLQAQRPDQSEVRWRSRDQLSANHSSPDHSQ